MRETLEIVAALCLWVLAVVAYGPSCLQPYLPRCWRNRR